MLRAYVHHEVRHYPPLMRKYGEHPNGVIGEDDAREAWIEAIDELRERGETEAVAVGREIARELDWIEIEREHNPDAKVKRMP